MKKSISKFLNIEFPIFGLKKPPHKIVYSRDKILCYLQPNGTLHTLDDKSIPGDYFNRLLHVKNRIMFDYTCRHVQDLVYTKIRWAMDKNGTPIDLSTPCAAKAEKRKVKTIDNSLIWLEKISYPFEISTSEIVSLKEELYAIIIHINGVWYLRELTYSKEPLSRPYIYV